jgi:hypothetical protein
MGPSMSVCHAFHHIVTTMILEHTVATMPSVHNVATMTLGTIAVFVVPLDTHHLLL